MHLHARACVHAWVCVRVRVRVRALVWKGAREGSSVCKGGGWGSNGVSREEPEGQAGREVEAAHPLHVTSGLGDAEHRGREWPVEAEQAVGRRQALQCAGPGARCLAQGPSAASEAFPGAPVRPVRMKVGLVRGRRVCTRSAGGGGGLGERTGWVRPGSPQALCGWGCGHPGAAGDWLRAISVGPNRLWGVQKTGSWGVSGQRGLFGQEPAVGESGNWAPEAGLEGEAAWGCLRAARSLPAPTRLPGLSRRNQCVFRTCRVGCGQVCTEPLPTQLAGCQAAPLSVHGGGGVQAINLRTRSETSSGRLLGPEGTSGPGLRLHLQKHHFPLNSPQTF